MNQVPRDAARKNKGAGQRSRFLVFSGLVLGIIGGTATVLNNLESIGKFFVSYVSSPITEFLGPSVCYPYEPLHDAPDKAKASRRCLPGRLTYVKWIDESAYSAVNRETGRWPNDRANRILTVLAVDSDGTPLWEERDLLRADGDIITWQGQTTGGWTEIVGASPDVVPGKTGALLRRQDPDQRCEQTGKRRLLETFLPVDLPDRLNDRDEVQMRFRWSYFDCAEKTPLEFQRDYTPFSICVGATVRAAKDR
jgi:hypothetical protein